MAPLTQSRSLDDNGGASSSLKRRRGKDKAASPDRRPKEVLNKPGKAADKTKTKEGAQHASKPSNTSKTNEQDCSLGKRRENHRFDLISSRRCGHHSVVNYFTVVAVFRFRWLNSVIKNRLCRSRKADARLKKT